MTPYTILVCDDKEAVHESLSFFLQKEGMEVLDAYDGTGALLLFASHRVDLAVLDVSLPDMDGMELCRRFRQSSDLPILFLSARTEEEDRIAGLEIGGDDYVTKPYSPREVALRVKKLLQRRAVSNPSNTSGAFSAPAESQRQNESQTQGASPLLQFAELSVNPETMEVFVKGEKIDMTGREVQFLAYMVENRNRVLNREQILTAVWGFDYYGETRTVDATVKRIRKKLPSENVHFAIQSIYGVGYRLGPTEEN